MGNTHAGKVTYICPYMCCTNLTAICFLISYHQSMRVHLFKYTFCGTLGAPTNDLALNKCDSYFYTVNIFINYQFLGYGSLNVENIRFSKHFYCIK